MEQNNRSRSLGIDALRCLAMLFIVCLHVMNRGGAASRVSQATADLLLPLKVLANCGVSLYALISGWVLVYGSFRPARILELWLQVIFWNLLIAGVGTLLEPGSMEGFWLRYCLPLTQKCFWYFSAYVGVYALTPLLNPGIRRLTSRQARAMVWTMLLLFSLGTALGYAWQGDPWGINAGYSVLWLLALYVMGACARHGGLLAQKPLSRLLLLALACLALTCACSGLLGWAGRWGELWRRLQGQLLYYTSPLLTLLCLSLLLIFSRLKPKGWLAALIRWLSALTFGVYIIHVHHVIWVKLENLYYPLGRVPALLAVPVIVAAALGLLLACAGLDWVRAGLFRALRVRERAEALLRPLTERLNDTKE